MDKENKLYILKIKPSTRERNTVLIVKSITEID